MRARRAWKLAGMTALLVNVGDAAGLARTPPPANRPVTDRHYAFNPQLAAEAIGVNLWDVGPGAVGLVPPGDEALVFVGGDYESCTPQVSDADFQAAVHELAAEPKMFGWHLWDEPNLSACPKLAGQIRARARYVKAHAKGQRVFVSSGGGNGESVPRALRPRKLADGGVDIDLLGLDPYPCVIGRKTCTFGLIERAVQGTLRNGIPRKAIVPVYQGFGQERCGSSIRRWRKPRPSELERMFREWNRLVPRPVFDAVYGWGKQSVTCQTVGNSRQLQAIFRKRFARQRVTAAGAPPARRAAP